MDFLDFVFNVFSSTSQRCLVNLVSGSRAHSKMPFGTEQPFFISLVVFTLSFYSFPWNVIPCQLAHVVSLFYRYRIIFV